MFKQILLLVLLVGLVEIRSSIALDEWDEWGEWTPCTFSCGGGVSIRVRDCNGTQCGDGESETDYCNDIGCPVDGGWSDYIDWSSCSAACMGGNQTRTRSCTNPEPAHGGADCVGESNEEQFCNQQECPIDGGWSEWTEWTYCNTDCHQYRYRACNTPEPQHGGEECIGEDVHEYECSIIDCPVDGQWGKWYVYDCDTTCHGRKTRDCDSPRPIRGGAWCNGSDEEEYGDCNVFDCVQDGAWSNWGGWSECSKTCDYGIQSRYRECTNPSPRKGGTSCPRNDPDTDDRSCNLVSCPPPLSHRKKYKPKTSISDIDYALILAVIFGSLGGLTLILLIILGVRRKQLKIMRDKAVDDREKTPLYKEAAEMSIIPVGKRSAAAKLRRQMLKSKLKKSEAEPVVIQKTVNMPINSKSVHTNAHN